MRQGSSSPAGPGPGTGTGSSDGSNGDLRLRAYAKVDAAHPPDSKQSHGIPVMISITATALPGITEHQRAPVDLVVVLHIRPDNSLPSNWENLLMEAMNAIVKSLDDTDGLAVIPGQSALMTPRKFRIPHKVPYATTSLVGALESADLILHGRDQEQEDKKRRAGHIVVISNSKDDMSPLLAWRFRSIHAFSLRDAHNARTMHGISSSRNCTYAVLDDSLGRITQAFVATISTITSGTAIASMPIEVKLMCEQTVVLNAVGTPGVNYHMSYDMKSGIIWPSVTTTNILVYLGHLQQPKHLPQLFNVHVKQRGYGNRVVDVQLVEEGSNGSKEVAAEIVRVKAIKIIASIVHDMDDESDLEQLHAAADDLRQQWTLLENSGCGREAGPAGLISRLAAQMREMEVRLYNNYYWLEYMLSWHSHQQCQLPLPHPLMEAKQSANDPLLQLRILATPDLARGTTQEHQKSLPVPVMVRIVAPEAGLAMVERASIDLIVVIDASSHGLEEKKKKTRERLQLLKEADEMEAQHNKTKKTVDESEKRLEKRLDWLKMKDQFTKKSLELMKDQITLKTLQMKDQLTREDPIITRDRRENMMKQITERRQDMMEPINQKRREMEGPITKKREEMNTMANTTKNLRAQATQLEKDVNDVMENINKRLDLLGKAMELVKNKLSVNDRLAIIPVKSNLAEPATDLFESETSNKVQQLSMPLTYNRVTARPEFCKTDESFGALQWRKQSEKTMRLIRDCLHSAPSSSTPTTTSARSQGKASMTAHSPDVDGRSTKTLQKALMDARKILDNRQGEEKGRQGFIIIISDSDDDSICMENLSPKYTVHSFGFYGMHNTRAMYHIASSSNGIYNIINDDRNQITEAFTSCINRMTSTIAVNTKVEIMCSPSSGVALSTIESGPFRYSIHGDKKSSSILVGALSAGTVKNFIVYVDNVHDDDHRNFSNCFQVHVRWMHPLSGAEKLLKGKVFVVRNGTNGYEKVIANIAHVQAVQIASNITDPNYSQTTTVADKLCQMCIKCPEFSRSAGTGRLTWLSREMTEIDKNKHMAITNSNYYKNMMADRLAYILSWLSYQRSYCWISVL